MKRTLKIGLFAISTLFFFSCQNDVVFNNYQPVEKAAWRSEQVIAIEFPVQDTISTYNLFINLRNTKEYAFSNLFLIAHMSFPNNVQVTDTLEYEMADLEGNFLGSGFSDIKENKLFYKENIRFPKKGIYLFEVKQSMRKRNEIENINPLMGISDIGLSIEKTK